MNYISVILLYYYLFVIGGGVLSVMNVVLDIYKWDKELIYGYVGFIRLVFGFDIWFICYVKCIIYWW